MKQRGKGPPHSIFTYGFILFAASILISLLNIIQASSLSSNSEINNEWEDKEQNDLQFGITGWKGGTKWASPEMEAMDEIRDAQLLRAVQDSVAAWEKRRNHHRQKRAEGGSNTNGGNNGSVCYESVGCFKDSGPYGYIDMLPSSPEEVNTRFLMYSSNRNRRGDTPLLDVGFTNLSAVYPWAGKAFNLSAPTKVIVHGFGSSCSHVWVYEMRSALMSVEECNVICVDWENGASFPNYVRAAANARLVGKQVALLIKGLSNQLGLNAKDVHLIGFSLGAHVAGFAGAELKNISRITGLDPAGPLFESQDPRARLDSGDAAFVDVIHSNGENLILGGLGSWQPMGHVDFYPNGGRMQKGCTNLFVGAVTDILWSVSEAEGRSLCNHRRAYKFFTDSVSPRCQFPAMACDSFDRFLAGHCFPCPLDGSNSDKCGNMGYYADRTKGRGTLYLVTREEEPFCAHQYLARVESTPSALPVVSYGRIQLTLIGNADLNETFTLTQKDDEQLVVGSALSRIIVPHPAVQEPVAVQILYTAYSGWISSGLAKWSIDKIQLMDSFSNMLSVCKRGLVLESGIAAMLPLYTGDCRHPTTSLSPISEHSPSPNTSLESVTSSIFGGGENGTKKYIPTQVVHLGDEIVGRNVTGPGSATLEAENLGAIAVPEYPEKSGNTGNGLELFNSPQDKGRGFILSHLPNQGADSNSTIRSDSNLESMNSTSKVALPLPDSTTVMLQSASIASSKNLSSSTLRPEIREPILSSTTTTTKTARSDLTPPSVSATESWHHWSNGGESKKSVKKLSLTHTPGNNETSSLSERPFVVQLFPQRLVTLLEQAERYARIAFSPFVSPTQQQNDQNTTTSASNEGQTPTTVVQESRVQRMLKYLPTFWSTTTTTTQSSGSNDPGHQGSGSKRFNRQVVGGDLRMSSDGIALMPYSEERKKSGRFIPRAIPLQRGLKDENEEVIDPSMPLSLPPMLVDHQDTDP